ncbi:histidine phosphatase family protein [Haloferax mediterranei ATCC 33500]|uniref:Histidine phosphatase family protein n=1 Tax=Haloferax mediterranei (strain ATCC 33500 / DSM 1411 / JCM 8866 / NBRC 14739 / NCIMB 2177 / R-4) TaxID=523841 RepID=I3R119_HALMT|nr:histidine phosphatase family protein [Haloferax mediterranei]AFK17929.1 phosphoglycerate mutase [Haloferax mediterranei ATCC 33500]AHZ22649.1 phosphoglycerate mutase [Haloferax mediterranei ATCC 33500]EMA02794.1 phosphoglycerate mutase [Haloferax mediterranei ATCC 33500]MDX5988021.1 histidine phosphatase family protein [Haloferax mediterranei ATCC 33500]QCQ74483.1 histidine phosphatase family protein [Haloferax mediterranei ATCC 33500]
MATLLLVRHGETTWNRAGRVQGWAPVSLTERGQSQASALARHVADSYEIDRLISSDIERAQETARPIARELDIEPVLDPSWRERDVGSFQGLEFDELTARYPQYSLSAVGSPAARERPPSGESLVEVRRRVLNAHEGLADSLSSDETVLVVTHGAPIRLSLGEIKGLDIVEAMLSQSLDNGSLCEVEVEAVEDDEPRIHVVAENETRFLTV